MSTNVEDTPTDTVATMSVPPPGRGRVYHIVQGFATDGDEFVVSTTGETITFPKPSKRPDPAGIYYSAATHHRQRQDPPHPLLDSSSNAGGAGGGSATSVGGRSVGSAAAAVGSGVCVAALSAYALKHHQSRRSINKATSAANADNSKATEAGRVGERDPHAKEPLELNVRRPDPSEAPNARQVPVATQKTVSLSIPSVVYVTESHPEHDQEPSLCSQLDPVEKGAAQGDEETCPELAIEELDVTAMTRTPKKPAPNVSSSNGAEALALHASASPFGSAVVRMDSREGVSEFADRLCEVSSALQATMASKGIRLDEKTTLKLAVRRLEKQDQQDFEIAKEMRRYMFEHGERDVDRKQKDRHHQESVDVHREAKGWLAEVTAARSMCDAQLINGVMWCGVAVVCLPVAYQSVQYIRVVYDNGIWAFPKLLKDVGRAFCSTCYSPPTDPTSYRSWLMGHTSYVPSLLQYSAVGCCAARCFFAAVGVLTLYGSSRFVSDRLTAVLLVGGALYHSAGLSAYYVASQMIPLVVLLAALVLGLYFIRWTHLQCTASLKKGEGRSPSNAEVTEVLAHFETISHWIAILTPSLGLTMLCAVAVLSR